MSIATEISRLQTAKADIKSAIEAKGVTVPNNATLDTYDTYVSQISGGGGGTNYLEQYANSTLSGAVTSTQLGTNIGSTMSKYFLYGQPNITSVDLTGTGATVIAAHFCDHSYLTNVTIPSTVYNIGDYFLYYSKVTSITVPNTATFIGMYFLNYCNSLTQIIYNSHTVTTKLPNYFAANTNSLALVDINSSITAIQDYSMSVPSANTNLLEVVLRRTDGIVTVATKVCTTNSNAVFRYRRNVKVYVPSALIASYEANTNWAAGVSAGYLTFVALEGSQYE